MVCTGDVSDVMNEWTVGIAEFTTRSFQQLFDITCFFVAPACSKLESCGFLHVFFQLLWISVFASFNQLSVVAHPCSRIILQSACWNAYQCLYIFLMNSFFEFSMLVHVTKLSFSSTSVILFKSGIWCLAGEWSSTVLILRLVDSLPPFYMFCHR